jgi:hypothetical protein
MNKHIGRKDRKFLQVKLSEVRLNDGLTIGIYVVAGMSKLTLISGCSSPERSIC